MLRLSIGESIFSEFSPDSITLSSTQKMIENVKERKPIVGLPNFVEEPEKFEKAYAQIEKSLKVIATVIKELYVKMEASSDEEVTKDLKEKLECAFSRLSEISEFFGTRYSQDLPLLYHGELTSIDDLECIQEWQKDEIAIPSYSDPKQAIKAHLTPLLYKLKMEKLNLIYDLTAESEQNRNVHERSSFWKDVKEPFHLDEGVDTDPLARSYHANTGVLKDLFFESLENKEFISRLKNIITAEGGDNPYSSLISRLATQNGE